MAEVSYKGANRRYRRMFFPVMAVYAVACFAGPFLFKAMDNPPVWVLALTAVLTGAPIAGVFWLIGRYVRETDEYTRKIQLDAMMTGGGITLSLVTVWGFLELYEVIPVSKDFPMMMMVAPAFFFSYGASYVVQQLRRGEKLSDPLCVGKDEA